MNITDGQAEYCARAAEFLKNQGLRVDTDLRNEKVGFKIREHTLQRVPYLLVAGDRESGSNTLAVRTRSARISERCLSRRSLRGLSMKSRAAAELFWRYDASLPQRPSASGVTKKSPPPSCESSAQMANR